MTRWHRRFQHRGQRSEQTHIHAHLLNYWMRVFARVSRGCQLHAKYLPSWGKNCFAYWRERVTFPQNNLESVLVRDFLLQSLICITPPLCQIPASQRIYTFLLWLFYLLLAEYCLFIDSHPCTSAHWSQVVSSPTSVAFHDCFFIFFFFTFWKIGGLLQVSNQSARGLFLKNRKWVLVTVYLWLTSQPKDWERTKRTRLFEQVVV